VPRFLRAHPLFGECELILLYFHSISVLLLEWRVFIWIVFIAAFSSTIDNEESASGVSQPLLLLCLDIPQPAVENKHS